MLEAYKVYKVVLFDRTRNIWLGTMTSGHHLLLSACYWLITGLQ
jgi:hypothetical protein